MVSSAAISLSLLLLSAASAVLSMPEPVGLSYNPLPLNNVESAILSISERLRTLDSFIFTSQKWDLTLDSHSRKLESLESKISRLETLLDLKIEKLADAHHSKTVKEELARDQLSSKIDKVYERLNHRMSYTESRIESSIVKQKTILDATLNGISQQLENLEKNNNEVENDLMEIASNLDEVKSNLVNLNASISNATEAEANGNGNGNGNANHRETLKKIDGLGEQFNSFATKVSNIFHDTSVKIKTNEEMLKTLLDAFNSVKKEMQDANHNLKSLKKQACPNEHLEFLIDKVENMARENEANYERLDSNIERLHMKQELYQESCHRIQVDELQIENRIGHTLDRILDSIDNRTLVTDRNYETILERLKAQNYAIRLTSQCTNTVLKLKEQLNQELKILAHDITVNNPTYGKIDVIINNLKHLQEQFVRLNATLSCTNESTNSDAKGQQVLNATTTILGLIQSLNDSINVVIDKMDQEHRAVSDWPDTDDSYTKTTKMILDILNVTDAELTAASTKGETQASPSTEDDDKGADSSYDLADVAEPVI